MPILQLVLLGYAATSDVRNIPLVVLDQDKSPASRTLLESFRAADYFRQAFDVNSESELRNLIDAGSARAGIIIPPDYSSRLAAGRPAQVAFIIDGSDPAIAGTTLAAATLIGQARATALSVERLAARGLAVAAAPAIEVRTRVWYNPDLIAAYYMIPAVVGLILQFLTVILTATTPLLALYAAHHAARAPSLSHSLSREARDPVVVITDARAFLAPLPLATAAPPPALAQILAGWGVHTLGALTDLPRADITLRLGAAGAALWARAAGETTRPLHPVSQPREFSGAFAFEDAVETLEPLLFILRRLIDRLTLELTAAGFVAEELSLALTLADESTHTRTFRLPTPSMMTERQASKSAMSSVCAGTKFTCLASTLAGNCNTASLYLIAAWL